MEQLNSNMQLEVFERLIKNPPKPYEGTVEQKQEWSQFVTVVNRLFEKESVLKSFLTYHDMCSFFMIHSPGPLLDNELFLLEKTFSEDELKVLLEESVIGNPPIISTKYNTSHNMIHHLYHLVRYYCQCSQDIREVNTVVEWGGGYGNMCKVLNKFAHNLQTYVIFDLPEVLRLQCIYLQSIFGEDKVNYSQDGAIQNGKINLLSFDKFIKGTELNADLFLSTWSLSESPMSYHQQVSDLNWFGAKKMLLSFHQCGSHIPFMQESTNLGLLAKKSGCKIKDVKIIPGINYYAFR